MWSIPDEERDFELQAHTGAIHAVLFSPGKDSLVHRLSTGKPVPGGKPGNILLSLSFQMVVSCVHVEETVL